MCKSDNSRGKPPSDGMGLSGQVAHRADKTRVSDIRLVAQPSCDTAPWCWSKPIPSRTVAFTVRRSCLAEVTRRATALPGLQRNVEQTTAVVAVARQALAPIPAKRPATELDPDATRARQRLQHRGLQMVCRLLAFNAEAWLAEHLNTYLADPNEYRAIMRNLLHLGGQIDYQPTTITLDRPDTPRIAAALELLTNELNTGAAHLLGDRRPIRYKITPP
jgi:hypothetical protein